MGEMEMIIDTEHGKVANVFKDDGSIVQERAFECDECHRYFAESKLRKYFYVEGDWAAFCEDCD